MSSKLITPGELLLHPTGLDWATVAEDIGLTDVLPGDAAQFIEQNRIIDDASEWVANHCEQSRGLHSTTQTEVARIVRVPFFGARAWADKNGWLNFKAANLPVTSVTSFQYGLTPGPMVFTPASQGVSSIQVTGTYPQMFKITEMGDDWTWTKSAASYLQVVYTAGYPNAVLTATATAGASAVLTVDSTLGMAASNAVNPEMLSYQQNLSIYDGANSEDVIVTSVTDATHVVVANLANTHTFSATVPIGISGLPRSIKLACINACVHFARERGVQAITMGRAGASLASKGSEDILMEAEFLLEPFVMKM